MAFDEHDGEDVTREAEGEPKTGCPYCGARVNAGDLADHVEVEHKRPKVASAASYPDSHVVSVPPLMPRSARRGAAVPKRATADPSAEKPARRTRTRRTGTEGAARSLSKATEREYKLQVPAPDSPPFLTKADFDRERTAKERPAAEATQPKPGA